MAVSLFNYEQFIESCLESVAAQTFDRLHLIVVDDCSKKDKSVGCAQTWMVRNQGRFISGQLIVHEYNRGLAEARNTAFASTLCDHVFVLDADNKILPSCIFKLKRALRGGADASYSQLVTFGDAVEIGFADYWSKINLASGPYIDAMALISKQIWQKVGGYTHIDGGWEDYDFWCKLAEAGATVCYVPEILGKYRVHQSSMLRTDSATSYDRLYNVMSFRHPWTKLRGSGGFA